MTTLIIVGAVAVVASFIAGVLVGRRNKNSVELAVSDVKALLKKAGIDA